MNRNPPPQLQLDFIKLRWQVQKEYWEKKKQELIEAGVPAESLELPRPRKKTEE